MFFKKNRKTVVRYTMRNLTTNEIEIFDLYENEEYNFVNMGYYDIINKERI